MAMIIAYELESGLVLEEAYVRIDSYQGDNKGVLHLTVGIYVNKAARMDEKPPILSFVYSFNPDFSEGTENILRQGYLSIRANDPIYANAIDDLEEGSA